jgi:hypothetical protein
MFALIFESAKLPEQVPEPCAEAEKMASGFLSLPTHQAPFHADKSIDQFTPEIND